MTGEVARWPVWRADLHVHTCLSPCASLDMSPRRIVREALERGLALIAITDHNSAENTPGVVEAARGSDLTVLPGLEITTSEEVHLLAIFAETADALDMQMLVYRHLQPGSNDEDAFGLQVVANARDEVMGMNPRLLIGATSLSVDETVDAIHARNGLAVAAHVDRPSFSLVSQLGLVPADLALDALEYTEPSAVVTGPVDPAGRPWWTSSDAHEPWQLARRPAHLRMAAPTFDELCRTLLGEDGRTIESEA